MGVQIYVKRVKFAVACFLLSGPRLKVENPLTYLVLHIMTSLYQAQCYIIECTLLANAKL
jgi:hypothetical protein